MLTCFPFSSLFFFLLLLLRISQQHPWRLLSLANWVKYPSVKRPDLVSVDIIDKRIDPQTGRLHIKRLLVIEGVGYPAWLKKMLGSSVGYFVDETVVDAASQTLDMKSHNLTFSSVVRLEEHCRYEPHPDRPNEATLFTQIGTVTALPYGMQRAIEFACVRSFAANAEKGRSIMEDAILRVRAEAERVKQEADAALQRVVHEVDDALVSVKNEAKRVKAEADAALHRAKSEVDEVVTSVQHKTADVRRALSPARTIIRPGSILSLSRLPFGILESFE
jgi:hypothetical protein